MLIVEINLKIVMLCINILFIFIIIIFIDYGFFVVYLLVCVINFSYLLIFFIDFFWFFKKKWISFGYVIYNLMGNFLFILYILNSNEKVCV